MATAAEKRHMGLVAALCCLACRNKGFYGTPALVHHVRHHGKKDHYRTFPLCFNHHSADSPLPDAVHRNLKLFEQEHGTEESLIQQTHDLLKVG